MSYEVNFYGHKNTASAEEAEAFERETAAKVQAFVETLDGFQGGSFSGGHVGSIALNTIKAEDSAVEPATAATENTANDPGSGT
jgi:hypothetical protein